MRVQDGLEDLLRYVFVGTIDLLSWGLAVRLILDQVHNGGPSEVKNYSLVFVDLLGRVRDSRGDRLHEGRLGYRPGRGLSIKAVVHRVCEELVLVPPRPAVLGEPI